MLRELLARKLQLPLEYIDKIARSASKRYKVYLIRKRVGGYRTIHHPAKELKALQRWLLQEVIQKWPVHSAAYAYEKGKNIRSNAAEHANSSYLLRMDIKDFFPSLTRDDIRRYFAENPTAVSGWDSGDIEFFIRIVCRSGCLTIGAPTSPRISNVLCRSLDVVVTELCDAQGIKYTRYADDLFFSTRQPEVLRGIEKKVREILEKTEWPANLRINADKTHHSSKKGRRIVTGLTLTQESKVSLGRKQKRHVKSLIHRYEGLSEAERIRLKGYLAYIHGVEPNYINNLVMKYGAKKIRTVMGIKKRTQLSKL